MCDRTDERPPNVEAHSATQRTAPPALIDELSQLSIAQPPAGSATTIRVDGGDEANAASRMATMVPTGAISVDENESDDDDDASWLDDDDPW